MSLFLVLLDPKSFKSKADLQNATISLRDGEYAELSDTVFLTESNLNDTLFAGKISMEIKGGEYLVFDLCGFGTFAFGEHPAKESLTALWRSFHHELQEKARENLESSPAYSSFREFLKERDKETARLRKLNRGA